jgi:hypothetical protein
MPATIRARADREAALHTTALKIREALDQLREHWGDEADEAEERCLELVTGEDDS